MVIRILGATLTVLAGSIYAVTITKEHRRNETLLEELILVLDHISWELETNFSNLAICCREAGQCGKGTVGLIFLELAQQLDRGQAGTVSKCFASITQSHQLPQTVLQRLAQLGDILGRYDLSGQISGIRAMQELCKRDLHALAGERTKTVKSCQALGLCTGAAVAILLL